jgi:GTP-binding protein Era
MIERVDAGARPAGEKGEGEAPSPRGTYRCGFIAIVGRPNVGKSTLLNQIVGHKVAIVTPKPQTTRSRILGVKTLPDAQLIFVDTPGLHRARTLINRRMVETAEGVLAECDVVLWVVDAVAGVTAADEKLAERFAERRGPLCVALNKIDLVARPRLLPVLADLHARLPGSDVVPVSARGGENLPALENLLVSMLPEGPRCYEADTLTDQTERTLVQEVVREQVLLQTKEEVPYGVAVTVDTFEDKGNLAVVAATIHVERASHKGMVIGARGRRIKEIGSAARHDLEGLLGRRLHLELFVRVQENWTTRPRLLREFGL